VVVNINGKWKKKKDKNHRRICKGGKDFGGAKKTKNSDMQGSEVEKRNGSTERRPSLRDLSQQGDWKRIRVREIPEQVRKGRESVTSAHLGHSPVGGVNSREKNLEKDAKETMHTESEN